MKTKFWAVLSVFFLVPGCAGLAKYGTTEQRETVYGKSPSVISQSWASTNARPGDTWLVYLKANDPDGDMKAIFSTIMQPGVGYYSVSITRIKPQDRKDLNGYIYLNTGGEENLLNLINITLSVQIQDRSGHFSQPAVFPLSLNYRYVQESPPPGEFQKHDLGPIMIRLRTTGDGGTADGTFP